MLEEVATKQQSNLVGAEQLQPAPSSAPPTPLIVNDAGSSSILVSLHDFWLYRELVYFLIWRDLKIRYKQTALGVAWVILQPLTMTIVFTIFLGRLARVPSDNVPYLLLVYSGLMPWTFFSNAILYSGNSLITNTSLITKVYFPRAIIPAAAIGARLVDFCIALIILMALLLFYGVQPTRNLLMFPAFVLLMVLLSLAVGLWTSALNVKYRDVGFILPVIVQLWMFVSPVVYPASLVPARWRWLYSLNPMTGIIEGVRSSLLHRPFNWVAIGISSLVTACLLVYSIIAFRRMEMHFADVI